MHLRVAAGVCALSTGLLIAGPAVAIASADTGSEGAAATDASTRPSTPARGPIGSIADSLRKAVEDTAQTAVQGVTGTLSALGKSNPQQSSSVKPPKMNFGGTPTVHGSTGTETAADEPVVVDTSADETAAPDAAAVELTAAEGSGSATPPAPIVAAPPAPTFPAAAAPVVPALPVVPDVVTPVSNVIAALGASIASAPALVASLPTSTTPVSDVLASLQTLLNSVVDASTPLVQLPSDLSDLLGVVAAIPGTTTGVPAGGVGSSVATRSPLTAPVPGPVMPIQLLPGFEVAPAPPVVGGPPTLLDLTATASGAGVTNSVTTQAAPAAGASVLSIVERVIGAVVATVSITALLAMALPGILGLLGTCAAGMRIGYRQAKAGSELPATAIARFVGSGPVGVVRSGSQVSMRPRIIRPASRAPRAADSARSTTLQLLDRAV